MSRVLVIDDELPILKLVHLALTRSGHVVETAAGGQEGIRKFDDGAYDVVVTDIRMPDLDGNQVLCHIRRSPKRVPTIGLSGTPWLLSETEFDTVIKKPFPLQDLIDSVTSLSAIRNCP